MDHKKLHIYGRKFMVKHWKEIIRNFKKMATSFEGAC